MVLLLAKILCERVSGERSRFRWSAGRLLGFALV
jgi:hypothetical protein